MPTLEDGDFYLFDSHAINAYLVSKYGKTDSLYPKELQKRAIVDQRLHFDSGILFPRMGAIVVSIPIDCMVQMYIWNILSSKTLT